MHKTKKELGTMKKLVALILGILLLGGSMAMAEIATEDWYAEAMKASLKASARSARTALSITWAAATKPAASRNLRGQLIMFTKSICAPKCSRSTSRISFR